MPDDGKDRGGLRAHVEETTARLVVMARYRNRMVHFYHEVTDRALYDLLTTRLDDFEKAIEAVTLWLAAHPDRVSDPSDPPEP